MRITTTTSMVALAILAAGAPPPIDHNVGMATPITKRSRLVNADNTVNFDALNSHAASIKAKIRRGLNNFEKNTGRTHASDIRRAEKRGIGTGLPLTDYTNELWYGSISVGTPPQLFTVNFDTGSSDLFLPGAGCDSTCSGHTIWDPSASSTSQDLGMTFTLTYGDGSNVSGEQYTDTVSVAGFNATAQTLGAANTLSSGFQKSQTPADGLMGMAYQSISVENGDPVMQTLISQKQVHSPVFSFKLSSSGSELFVGGSNSALYTGGFTYTPVTQQGYWQVNMDNIKGNGQVLMSNIDSIVDTGTTLIVGEPSQVATLYNQLGGKAAPSSVGSGFYTFPCDAFPKISLTFDFKQFPISASSLNLGPVSSGSSDCVSGLIGLDTGASFWILGDVFLRNVYTKFDLGRNRVGFASLA